MKYIYIYTYSILSLSMVDSIFDIIFCFNFSAFFNQHYLIIYTPVEIGPSNYSSGQQRRKNITEQIYLSLQGHLQGPNLTGCAYLYNVDLKNIKKRCCSPNELQYQLGIPKYSSF